MKTGSTGFRKGPPRIPSDSNRNHSRRQEPIAIVGMACRFPGANGIPAFWRLLEAGGNAVTEGVPGSSVGRMGELFPNADVQNEACRFCAFVSDIDQFDASFFRISPVEAQLLDPQQRMMLETSWQALEDAGIDPDGLKGSRTGVYAGISNNEYRSLILGASDAAEPAESLYAVAGTSFNTAIGRVAFALGLEGPAIAVDTACSSSLVAIHQAVSGLQRGEADLALAGGVNTILSGRLLELRGNAGMLAPDGKCKTFDASANGYVRGEGCGIVVLKRLTDAEADGERIWAVIRGSALNQDGASPGLTVPNGAAQERVIEAALSHAGVRPADVDYLEAHGTGTEVGDPIELQAAGTAYGKERAADRPLLIGSVKTNIGHLESAAGVAGLIKTVLAMNCGVIPRHLHFRNPNPQMDWDRLPVRITSEAMKWPFEPHRPPTAGVSGFGWSGTNAHVVLQSYDASEKVPQAAPERLSAAGPPYSVSVSLPESVADLPGFKKELPAPETRLLPLSGKTEKALRELAARYLSWLDDRAEALASESAATDPLLSDMAWTAGVGRAHFSHRAGLAFRDAESLRERLRPLAEGNEGPEPREAGRVAFLYTGQGCQWVGMGETLYASQPTVRAVLDRCDALLREERDGASLLDVMFGRNGAAGDLDDPMWKQPAIYALECALTALWSSLGVRPEVVLGHSLGEIAAAHTAGVFGLEEGLRFAAARGALIGALPGEGAMAAVFAPPSRVVAALEEHSAGTRGLGLSIAADNGAHQVVSGPVEAIESITDHFEAEAIRVRRLRKSPAYHSAMMEPALDDLEAALGDMAFAPPTTTLVSNLTGRVVEPDTLLAAAYWRRQARDPVAFRACVETLAELGVNAVVEIGPHAVLGPMTALAWPESAAGGRPPAIVSSLRQPPSAVPTAETADAVVVAVAHAYEAGLPIRFEGLFAGEARRRIALPGYPFQRERYWVEAAKRRRPSAGHPLLGDRHESARGEIAFETEVFPSDPAWLSDHRVFGQLVVPGALYGAMAASASLAEGTGSAVVEDFQMQSAMVFPQENGGAGEKGLRIQILLDGAGEGSSRGVQVLSRGDTSEGWTLHAEGRIATSPGAGAPQGAPPLNPEGLKAYLSPEDLPAYYRSKAAVGIDLGPSFRTLQALWSRTGEALGEIALPPGVARSRFDVHPLLLDGCFQVMAAAREPAGTADSGATYLPFAWERLWLAGRLPERVICHVSLRDFASDREAGAEAAEPPEVVSGDMRIYAPDGVLLGELSGYTVKRATRAALLSTGGGFDDLLYDVVWRDRAPAAGMLPADFLPSPSRVAAETDGFSQYLAAEGVDASVRPALMQELERLCRRYALSAVDKLGWVRTGGEAVDAEGLRQRLRILPEHGKMFRRMLDILARGGVLETAGDDLAVAVGSGDSVPVEIPEDPEAFVASLSQRYSYASNEIGILHRSASALADVLRGQEDPLTLLFGSGEPSAADLYIKAPVWRAANKMLADAVRTLLAGLPDGRRLRVIEVGAGTGSATLSVLPELPEGRFDYTFTDISAGFFAEAEGRLGDGGGCIEYRALDIEKDPVAQGFDSHGYDLLIASNVLHATRYLEQTLAHCGELLAPSGQLVALENLCGQDWLDMTFGQLDGWWRFSDDCRPRYALAGPEVWRQALGAVGFEEVEVLGLGKSGSGEMPDRGVIVARGPAEVTERPGLWVLAADRGGAAAELAEELAGHNQTVVLAGCDGQAGGASADGAPGIVEAFVEMERRESWCSLLNDLPDDVPLAGIVHLVALDGHGTEASTEEMAKDVRQATASALALTQAAVDTDMTPANGVWFVTRGAQVLERERGGQLAGATLWGLGKVAAREASQLQARMVDLDLEATAAPADLARELLYPDPETHIVHRNGRRRVARVVRAGSETRRLALPEGPGWVVGVGASGALEILPVERPRLGPREVRVAVEAAGLNFWDVFASLGLIEEKLLGTEMCGRVAEIGSEVSTVSVGDRVVGLRRGKRGTFGPEAVTREELVVPAPPNMSASALASMPTVFVSAALSFELAGLKAGDRVLIHAGAGGVGLAAIQLAQAAGAEVLATASAPKQAYLRSLGVEHVFDSRSTAFGQEILEATGGAGVDLVLNSLTAEGFIEATLSCLAQGGRFVELAARDILSEEEMAEVRPDVAYSIVKLDVLKEDQPAWPRALLKDVMARLEAGELKPLVHTRWPLAEAVPAIEFMRDGRHIGKIVFTNSPLASGRLRADRTYLVTGGLGGIGCAVAGWLVDQGAGTIVLNGRRPPDPEAEEAIGALRTRGATVRVELADVTDPAALDGMLARMDRELPALGGVIHSVGVLSDGALGNQSWEQFETVLWPKVLGAWHLHRATVDRDLDMFVLFSSVAGVFGSPGQSNHAAANAFLDQLAGHRRALGLPGQAIAWGAWSEIGEAEEQRERISTRIARTGIDWINPQQGLRAFEHVVREDPATAVVVARDWAVFGESLEVHPPLFEDLLSTADDADSDVSESPEDLLSRLREAPAATREELLVTFLQREVQAVLRLPSKPAPSVGFFDLGMDSLMAVELRNRLNRALSAEYTAPNTVVFDYPDIAALAAHLAGELAEIGGVDAAAQQPAPAAAPGPVARYDDGSSPEGIAIVGMACRFPGAPNLPAFWRQLEAGADAVTDERPEPGPWQDFVENLPAQYGAYRRAGFVDGIDAFDAAFFRITPIEARLMDPQQRMLLETAWQALEDAGIDPDRLRGSRTGVYAGVAASEYRDLMRGGDYGVGYLSTAASMTVGRVAFQLGLEGPTVPLELNCASSLIAVHQAVTGLRLGESDLALVGGTSAVLSAGITREMADLRLLSQEGRCKSFDDSADGFVRGEGCGMVVLKRLSEAESDGDRIWAVIRGSAFNQNGASAGATVPSGPAQERLIERALAQAGIAPSEVDYLEAYGGGSAFGDPIEVKAASAVYGKGRAADRPLLMGSVKTNIGHLEAAAGIAGLIKAVLAMKQGVVPRSLHFKNPSTLVDWETLPVRVMAEAEDWPQDPDRPPRAGVSAFGISGVNAHVVLEGYGPTNGASPEADRGHSHAGAALRVAATLPEPVAGLQPTGDGLSARRTRLLPLSAKSDEALRALAGRYLSWLDEHADALSAESAASAPLLSDMAWTAAIGRSHFGHRAGVVFKDAASLRQALTEHTGAVEGRGPRMATKVAFTCAGEGNRWTGMGAALYECEPVVRAVLDRCNAVLGDDRGESLLDAMFGRAASAGLRDDSTWARPATYSLACALAALWESVGIRPSVIAGNGAGEIAAAQVAGLFSLEDGLRLATAGGDPEGAPEGGAIGQPSAILVNSHTGRVVDPDQAMDDAYWRQQATGDPQETGGCAGTFAELGVEVVIEIGPGAVLPPPQAQTGGNAVDAAAAPTVVSSLPRPSDGEETVAAGSSDGGFVDAVARAYQTGLGVSFAGLFAGETRRRVSVPGYPFERRRFWLTKPGRPAARG